MSAARLGRWQQVDRGLAVLGVVGLAGLAFPTLRESLSTGGAGEPLVVLPLLLAIFAVAWAAYSGSAQARLVAGGIGVCCAGLAILGLWPLYPYAPWQRMTSNRYSFHELLLRVAVGPTAFAFCGLGAGAWCWEELRQLQAAVGEARAAAGPDARIFSDLDLPSSRPPAGTVIVLRLFAAAPIVVAGLIGSLATLDEVSDFTPWFHQLAWLFFLIPAALGLMLLQGIFSGSPRKMVLCCGVSAGLSLVGLVLLGEGLIALLLTGTWQSIRDFGLIGMVIAVLIGLCLLGAVNLIPAVVPACIPGMGRRSGPEEDLGAANRWDEAPPSGPSPGGNEGGDG